MEVKNKAMHYHTCKLRENTKPLLYHLSAVSYVGGRGLHLKLVKQKNIPCKVLCKLPLLAQTSPSLAYKKNVSKYSNVRMLRPDF